MNVWLLLFLLLLPLTARAAETDSASLPISAGGVNISADVLEYHDAEKVYIAVGHAEVEQNGTVIQANKLTAHYTEQNGKTSFTTLIAEGAVHINNAKGDVYGDRGVYDVARQVAVLKGEQLRLVTEADEIRARDSLEYWQKEQLVVARGAAEATRKDQKIQADILTGLLEKTATGSQEMQRVSADGHVVLTTPTDKIHADHGLYDVRQQKAQLDGSVKIIRGENILVGQRADVDMKTGISRLRAATGQRVRGLIIPKNAPQVP